MPSSSAGICRPPSRYRCSTMACPATGPGERTRRSVAPNVADRAATVPRTVTRRAPASVPVIRRPCPASTLVMSDRSAGSVPYCPANCCGVRVAGPSTRSRGSAARRRVTSVSSISAESSTAPSSCDPGSGPRSLPGKGTKDCPVMIAPSWLALWGGYCLARWCGRRRFRSQYGAGPGDGEPFWPKTDSRAHHGRKGGGRERPEPFPPSAGGLMRQAARDEAATSQVPCPGPQMIFNRGPGARYDHPRVRVPTPITVVRNRRGRRAAGRCREAARRPGRARCPGSGSSWPASAGGAARSPRP